MSASVSTDSFNQVWARDKQVPGLFETLLENMICVLIYKIKLIKYILLILSKKIDR